MALSPRVVRNFWVVAEVDGRRSRIASGPRRRDGGMHLTLYQRSEGSVELALTLCCIALPSGLLRLEVLPHLPWRRLDEDGQLLIATKR